MRQANASAWKRRVMSAALGLLVVPMIVLLLAGSAAARTPRGQWTVKPGQTIYLTNINLNSNDWAYGYVMEPGAGIPLLDIVDNYLQQGVNQVVDSASWSNTGTTAVTVTIALDDVTASQLYYADGTGEPANVNHATLRYTRGKVTLSINDGSTNTASNYQPTLGAGTLNIGSVAVKNTPRH